MGFCYLYILERRLIKQSLKHKLVCQIVINKLCHNIYTYISPYTNWKLAWRKSLFEWKKILKSHLLRKFQGLRIELEMEDSWVWKKSEFSTYSVNFAYVFLKGGLEGKTCSCM